jgi:hypothetical protein
MESGSWLLGSRLREAFFREECAAGDVTTCPGLLMRRELASMRKTLLVGAVLALATVLVVVLNDLLDLELDSVVLFGIAMGAVVALVPDGSLIERGAGFAAGVVVALGAYFFRAGLMPDSTSGQAVEVAVVVLVCTLFAVVSHGHVALWSTLLGAAAMTGAYEYTYNAAPPEVVSTSVSTVTSLFITVAVGFVVAAVAAPDAPQNAASGQRPPGGHLRDQDTSEPQMEKSK